MYNFASIIPISAKTKQNLNELVNKISENLPENEHIYKDNFNIEKGNEFMFSELIREKITKIRDELPHDTFVEMKDRYQK